MKLTHSRVGVVTDDSQSPLKINYRNTWYDVIEKLDTWNDTGEWWNGETEKIFYRLILIDGSVMEIYRDLPSNEWWSNKIYD